MSFIKNSIFGINRDPWLLVGALCATKGLLKLASLLFTQASVRTQLEIKTSKYASQVESLNCEIVEQYRVQIDFVVSFQMSRLFVASILDPPGELEQRLETAHRSSN